MVKKIVTLKSKWYDLTSSHFERCTNKKRGPTGIYKESTQDCDWCSAFRRFRLNNGLDQSPARAYDF